LDGPGLAEPGHRLQQHVPAPHLRREVDAAAQVRSGVGLAPAGHEDGADERTPWCDGGGGARRLGRIRGGDTRAVARGLLLCGERRRQEEQQEEGHDESLEHVHFPAPPTGARTGNAAGATWTCTRAPCAWRSSPSIWKKSRPSPDPSTVMPRARSIVTFRDRPWVPRKTRGSTVAISR